MTCQACPWRSTSHTSRMRWGLYSTPRRRQRRSRGASTRLVRMASSSTFSWRCASLAPRGPCHTPLCPPPFALPGALEARGGAERARVLCVPQGEAAAQPGELQRGAGQGLHLLEVHRGGQAGKLARARGGEAAAVERGGVPERERGGGGSGESGLVLYSSCCVVVSCRVPMTALNRA